MEAAWDSWCSAKLRRKRQISLQQPLKLDEGFLIEHDGAEGRHGDAPLAQTVADRPVRKPRIVLLARKPLFLGRRLERGGNVLPRGDETFLKEVLFNSFRHNPVTVRRIVNIIPRDE